MWNESSLSHDNFAANGAQHAISPVICQIWSMNTIWKTWKATVNEGNKFGRRTEITKFTKEQNDGSPTGPAGGPPCYSFVKQKLMIFTTRVRDSGNCFFLPESLNILNFWCLQNVISKTKNCKMKILLLTWICHLLMLKQWLYYMCVHKL